MKIENGYGKYIQSLHQQTQNQKTKTTKNTSETHEKGSGVQVNISEEAKRLSEASQNGESKRVEEIKKAVLNGTYEVSAEKISQGILKTVQTQKENSAE